MGVWAMSHLNQQKQKACPKTEKPVLFLLRKYQKRRRKIKNSRNIPRNPRRGLAQHVFRLH